MSLMTMTVAEHYVYTDVGFLRRPVPEVSAICSDLMKGAPNSLPIDKTRLFISEFQQISTIQQLCVPLSDTPVFLTERVRNHSERTRARLYVM